MLLSSKLIRHLVVSLITIFSTAIFVSCTDSDSNQDYSYDTSTNILTLSGTEVPWDEIGAYASTTEKVVFSDDYNISVIPEKAFFGFSKLAAIDIPDVVTTIDERAFAKCTSLASVSFPDGLQSIGRAAFGLCESLKSINLPESLQSLGECAFCFCNSLYSVTLPEGLEEIGESAFNDCTSLASISLPASLTSIGEQAFNRCYSLTSVTLPEHLKTIACGAFSDCAFLTTITLPASLTSIGEWAFESCPSLKTVEILSNGTPDNKHVIYLGSVDDKTSTGGGSVFPRLQATLIYDPETTWIGDDDTQNLRYYFDKFETPE